MDSAEFAPASLSAYDALPPISALFLIDFDNKAGYTISWQRQSPAPDVAGAFQLDGLEYKSLPSGLHTVTEDLVYFVHDSKNANDSSDGHRRPADASSANLSSRAPDYAGLSAFTNIPCQDADARNARMISVGILVPLTYGRLGRAWTHADGLKELSA